MAKTAYRKPKKKVHVFDIVNYIVFILIGLLVLVPIWKVVVDSFNAVGIPVQTVAGGFYLRWL